MINLKNYKKIAVISHANPDCDALGSLLGVFFVLKHANIEVSAVNVGPLPARFSFLDGFDLIKNSIEDDIDLLISLDCGKFSRLGIKKPECEILNIDHHVSNEQYGTTNIIDAKAPSASVVAFEFLLNSGFFIPKEAANCFYAALLADSGRFCYDNVNQKTFEIAAKLAEFGANPPLIGKFLTQKQSFAQVKLQAIVFNQIKIFEDQKLAVICVSNDDLKNANATIFDADGFADKARALDGIEVGICIRELDDKLRVSLRSKYIIDTTLIASLWGGGGHYHASGFEIDKEDKFDIVCNKIIETIKNLLIKENLNAK